MQNLAPGSEWINETTIGDAQGTYISIRPEASAVSILSNGDDPKTESDEAWTADILSIIDRANLDPVRIAARKLVEMCTQGLLQSEYNRREVAKLAKELKALL